MNLPDLILLVPAVLLALAVHEFAHAWVADRLGDPTPRVQGRLTLNPLAHLDPVGALMLLLFRFGWARPVQVDPGRFANPRRGMTLVALAGPLANVLLAFVLLRVEPLVAAVVPGAWQRATARLLAGTTALNLWLAAFNLIPLPPLDGARILAGLLPGRQAAAYARLESYGVVILILLVVSGTARFVLGPIYRLLALLVGS